MSRVFITQRAFINNRELDYSSAEKYGELRMLLQPGQMLAAVPAVRVLRRALQGFNDDDYLLLSGDPAAVAAACVVAAQRNNGRVKLLRWDRVYHEYTVIQLDATGREEISTEE